MANTTKVWLFGGLTHGSDVHKFFEDAQLSSPRLDLGKAQQGAVFSLPFEQSGIDSRFEARWRPEIRAHACHLLRNCSRARASRRSMPKSQARRGDAPRKLFKFSHAAMKTS